MLAGDCFDEFDGQRCAASLMTLQPDMRFRRFKHGDRWCMHMLGHVPLSALNRHALDLN